MIQEFSFCYKDSLNDCSDYFASASIMCYLCVCMPLVVRPSQYHQGDTASLVCAAHMKMRQSLSKTLMGLHECSLGWTEKQSFALPRSGFKPWPLDLQSRALASLPQTPVRKWCLLQPPCFGASTTTASTSTNSCLSVLWTLGSELCCQYNYS